MSKVMVSLPGELVSALDEEARKRSTSRSALIAEAARRELNRRDPDDLAAAVARSSARFERSGPFESADLVRHVRDGRR